MSYIGNEPVVSATRTITEITATAGQTVFVANGGYTVGFIDVFVNGAQLQTSDFTATNGSTVTLSSAATVGDDVRLVAWGTFSTGAITPAALSTPNAVYWDGSGNVGIGTTSPSGVLDVRKNQNATSNFYFQNTDTTSAASRAYLNLNAGTNYLLWKSIHGDHNYIDRATGTNLYFQCNNSTQAVLDSSGNLLVGTTSNVYGKLQVVSGASGGAALFKNLSQDNLILIYGNQGNSSSLPMYVMPMFFGDTTLRGSIYWTGSAVQYNTSSDYRLKENISPMTGALDKVSLLKPVTYTWKESGQDGQGFIAHELAEIVPDCVTGEKDAVDAEGNPVYQGIDTSFLVATLTAAIQELNAKVEAQALEIAALKGNV